MCVFCQIEERESMQNLHFGGPNAARRFVIQLHSVAHFSGRRGFIFIIPSKSVFADAQSDVISASEQQTCSSYVVAI